MGLSEFIQSIKNSFKVVPFDPSCFDHPTASKVSWSPKKGGGTSYKTRTLNTESSSKLVYKGSKRGKMLGSIFIIVPIIIMASVFISIDELAADLSDLSGFFIPLTVLTIGIFVIYYSNRPIVIDKQLGYLYKSYKKPASGVHITSGKNWVELDNLIALQLLSEHVSTKNSSFTSYEINFVFKDATRYNVVDHGNISVIESDAQIISDFLEVPIWNKMNSKTYIPKYTKPVSDQYDSSGRYDDEPFVDLNEDKDSNLDEPYNSLKRREL